MKSLCVNRLVFFLLCALWMKLTCAVPMDELRARPAWIQRNETDCWYKCGRKSGSCPKFCGEGAFCCRVGYGGCPDGAAEASPKYHTCVILSVSESVIFITGGEGVEYSSEVLDLEDSNSSCSRLTASLPDRRVGHSMSSLDDGELVLCGGIHTPTSCISTRSPNGTWETHLELTANRVGHASAVTGDTIHVLGGAFSPGTGESLEDGHWRRRGNLPYDIGIGACDVAVNDTAVFISGGSRAKTKSAMWNPVTDQWTPLADMDQHGRTLHGCTLITRGGNVFVLVAGGLDQQDILSTSRLYNVDGNYWSDAGELNQGRAGGVMVNTGEDVYYIGGSDGNNGLDSVEQFNIGTNKWVNTNIKLRRARSVFAAGAVKRADFC